MISSSCTSFDKSQRFFSPCLRACVEGSTQFCERENRLGHLQLLAGFIRERDSAISWHFVSDAEQQPSLFVLGVFQFWLFSHSFP